nr:RHS repeat-associated core domain-containing protein [uncultured Desulfobacter sp.]
MGNGNYVGGGFYYTGGDGQLVLVNSQVLDNISYSKCSSWGCSVTNRGGGVYSNGNLELTNSILRGNLSWAIDNASGGSEHNYSYGGGIYHNAGSLIATNCIISHNRGNPGGTNPYPYGGGIYVYSGTADITNCTIAYNERYGIYRNSGTVSAVNSIVYFNVVGQVAGTVDVTYSDVQDGFDGEGNIDGDPLFIDENNFHLLIGSPCFDTGTSEGAPQQDIEGNQRPQGYGYDMGAYEDILEADFSASITKGFAPLTVQFTNLSLGNSSEWQWDFDNDGVVDSTEKDPEWTYSDFGSYSVSLSIINGETSVSEIKENYITVTTIPEDITNLRIESFDDRVVLSWDHSINSEGDLDGYKVYFGEPAIITRLDANTNVFEINELPPASVYPVRVTAIDIDENESAGVTATAATLLSNPDSLTATPAGSMMDLVWNSVTTPDLVSQYAIYVSETDFTSVSGMTPKLRVDGTQTSTRLAGLEEDTLYYFAVTAINLSGNDLKTVTTVSATTESDPEGPEISDIRFNGELLTDGMTITVSGTLSLTATDISKISQVQFYDDANLLGHDQNGSSSYSMPWFIEPVADGTHTLTFTAYDTLDHSTTVTRTVNVTLAPPSAPVITSPATTTTTAESSLIVTGQSQVQNEIALLINGVDPDQWATVNSDGGFSIPVTLTEGENRIQAQARNRAGNSPLSAEIVVTLDTDQPQSPLHMAAESQEAGAIRLSWSRPLETAVAGYNIYRSATAFDSIATAEKINAEPVIGTLYIDLPDTDGTYYYGVTTKDLKDRESGLSTIVSAVSDRIMPAAVTIAYTPTGPYDPNSGRVGQGTVDVLLTVSEPLAAVPFFSLNPTGGSPMTLDMVKTADLTYAGTFDITADTPSGTAYAVFSGRDMAGNRGTEIQEGTSLLIDTQGPQIIDISLVPASPVRNDADNPVSITATIGLDEALKSDTVPELTCRLSGHGDTVFAVDTISQVDTIAGHAQTWQAVLTLSADAGEAQAETLRFVYNGLDDLGNAGGSISAANQFQIYQDDLPPLDAPTGLSAQSLAGGQIALTWDPVDGAAAYALYRQAPGESGLTLLTEIEGETAYTDAPALEGVYLYAVASIRRANDQETVSGLSDALTAVSDATAPAAPSDLTLALTAQGIVAEWADNATEPVTFSLFRSDQSSIPSVDGLTPVMTGTLETRAVDAYPQSTFHCYTVVAVDSAGNVSEPAPSMLLDFDLLPVSGLSERQEDEDPPVVTWSHADATVTGYDFYLGPEAAAVKINTDPMTVTTFTDTGYNGDERHYGVVALGDAGQESLQRRITLPLLQASLDENAVLLRRTANRLDYIVENRSTADIDNVTLVLQIEGAVYRSDPFDVAASSTANVSMIVVGGQDWPDPISLTTTLEIIPNEGELIEIVRSGDVTVQDSSQVLRILAGNLLRGGSSEVRFTLENTGAEIVEILTAVNSGSQASSDIGLKLLDTDGNVLSTATYRQNLGNDIVTLADGRSIARIPAGGTFESAAMTLAVPENAPDAVTLQLDISAVYMNLGKSDQQTLPGISTTQAAALIDTSYYGQVETVSPESSHGDEDILISGRALARATDEPLANVPLDLVISVQGFDRTYRIYTDANGQFSYAFTPMAGEYGDYTVWARHPELNDTAPQAGFEIVRLVYQIPETPVRGVNFVKPATFNIGIPRNYVLDVPITVVAGGEAMHNVRVEYNTVDQPDGQLLAGVHVQTGDVLATIDQGHSAVLHWTLWADNTAADTGSLILSVKSDENGEASWQTITVNLQFSEARPVLYFSPDHIETGMALDDTVTETITFNNNGFADMENVQLSLVDESGAPAPDWIALNTASDFGDLLMDESREIGIFFSPTADKVNEGLYTYYLRVSADNYPDTDILLFAAVTQSGIGNALIKVSDIYTGTEDPNTGETIQGLANASITLQNEVVLTETFSAATNSQGEALINDLPAGRYKCRVRASNHQEYIGRTWIKPGITTTKEVFLANNLVTVEWKVVPTTIQDKYEVVLTATYETNVPAAVLVAEPASVMLPDMQAGDVFRAEFTLTNYGLIRAQDLSLVMPEDNEYYRYELMSGLPDYLDAKEQITVSYRVVCTKSPDEDGSGGGCWPVSWDINIYCRWVCINGKWVVARIPYLIIKYECDDDDTGYEFGTSPPPVVSTPTWPDFGGSGDYSIDYDWGSFSDFTFNADEIDDENNDCIDPPPNQDPCYDPDQQCVEKETEQNKCEPTGSSVNTLMRDYQRRDIDFFIKVPGGTLDVERYYYNGKWYLSPVMTSLMFEYVEGDITVISKDGLAYLYRGVDLWTLSARKWIKKTVDGYLWESKTGRWRSYDDTGRQIAFGDRNGTIGTFIYNAGGDTITGIQDRNGIQVIWFETDIDGRITAAQDGESRRVTYTYTNGLLTDVEDVLGNNTRYGYDQSGRLSQVTDVLDRTHTIEYTGVGHVTSVTDQNNIGRSFSYNYDRGTLQYYTSIDLPSGAIKEVWYDQYGDTQRVDINGRTIQRIEKQGRDLLVYDAAGNETRKSYDEWDNLLQMVYPDGATITYEYDFDHHQVTRKTDERGIVTEYEYDANGNRTLMVEAVGTSDERITEWEYDVDGNLLIERQVGDADTAEAVTQMTYDAAGNMLSKTDPENHTTHYTYDIMGNLRTMEDPRGNTWEYVYDGRGQLREVIDSLTHTTHYEYDASGNKVKEVDAEGLEIQYEYDDHNNLIRSTAIADPDDPSENVVTIYEYNDNDQLIRRIDPEGKIVVRNEYDDMGRKSKTIDGNDNEIIFEYDDSSDTGCASCNGGSVDQPVRIIYPTFSKQFAYNSRGWKVEERDVLDESTAYTTFFDYDVAGNLIRVTDKMGNPTSYDFDSFDRQIRVTDALSHDTNYTFDNRNNLIALQDANGNTTRLEYDRNNRLVKEIRPMGEETQYVYDTMGNLITKIDAKNQKVSYIHDAANRMIEVHYFTNVGDAAPEKTTFFIYDDIGNLTGYDDGTTKGRYVYDLFHRKKSEIVDYGLFQLLHSYTYYRNGLKESFTGPDGITYAYSYDANNQLAQIQIPGIGSIAINEKEWNRPLSMTYPGGQTIDYKYDPLMRVSKIESKDLANNIIMAYLYSYDHMSNIIQKATEHGAYNYEYDNLYQLTRADNPLIDNEVYSYDAVGNRKTELGAENEWQYNSNNELIDYNGVVLDYDSNGNTIRRSGDDQVINYHYNIENRLIRIEDINASLIPTYYYDPFGRRLWKQIGEKIIFFHYSDEGLVGEFDQNSALLKSFGYVPGSIWNTYPMFLVTEGNYYWFNNDHIGTPQYIIDLNGSTVWRSSKNSFGKDIMGDDANDIDRLGFSGQYKDVESKLYYNLNRFYDPSIGRFISADPLGVEEEVNPYFYVRNNPLIRIDPLGLKEKEISIGNRQFEGWWFTGEKEYGKWTDGTPPGWPNPDGLYCSLYKWCKRRVYYRMRSAILETNDILNNIGPCGQAKVSHWIDFLMLAYNALIDVDEYANPRKIRFVKWVEPAKYRRSFLRKKWQTARTASSNHCSSFDNFPPSIIYE